MNNSSKILSDVTAFTKYARYLPHANRRESLAETKNRNMAMHLDKFPKLSRDIIKAYQYVHDDMILPSMRSMQFAGDAINKNNLRMYNCAFAAMDNVRVFGEALFLLLSGPGFGASVQRRHVNNLPIVQHPREEGIFMAHDSIIGWAQCLDALFEAYYFGRMRPIFNLSSIRPHGSYLVTSGGRAPGPEPLKKMLDEVEKRLKAAIGRRLRPIEVSDIICIIADCVLSGGIRRSACIILFDRDDDEMLKSKHGEWWVKHPYRARANISAVLIRNEVTKEEFDHVLGLCKKSGSGEPGVSFTNDPNWGVNPCVIGETEILTRDGYRRIDSLVDQQVEVWNGFEWSVVTPRVTGKNQDTVSVTMSDGRSLTCTLYHKFHIATDYRGGSMVVEAQHLEPGMKIIKHDFPVIEHGATLSNAYTQGFVSADGMDNYNFMFVYEPKFVCLNRLRENAKRISNENKGKVYLTFQSPMLPKNFIPLDYNLKSKLDWLAGLLDGDGTELKEGGAQITSIDFRFLSNVQKLLSTLGAQSKVVKKSEEGSRSLPNGKGGHQLYLCKEAWRLCLGARQVQFLKGLGLKCERLTFEKSPNRDASQFAVITDVTDAGTAEVVYCFDEPKRHLGVFNGILTGQCHEIALNSNQMCNLSTINQTGITSKKDFLRRVYSATLLGTLQATYTDFPYLRPIWKATTELEALLGVSATGIADSGGIVTPEWLEEGAKLALEVNEKYAKKLGINLAARITTIKPEGTASCVLGSSSGIHARHAQYYLRRTRLNKGEALDNYLRHVLPELVEDDVMSSTQSVLTLPQESPEGAILRENETALDLLNRAIIYNKHWIANGHRSGANKHNVSATISVKDHEWEALGEAMWKYRNHYSGLSLLQYDGGTHRQLPFEACTKEKYDEFMQYVKNINLREIVEESDNTTRALEAACVSGVCEINL